MKPILGGWGIFAILFVVFNYINVGHLLHGWSQIFNFAAAMITLFIFFLVIQALDVLLQKNNELKKKSGGKSDEDDII